MGIIDFFKERAKSSLWKGRIQGFMVGAIPSFFVMALVLSVVWTTPVNKTDFSDLMKYDCDNFVAYFKVKPKGKLTIGQTRVVKEIFRKVMSQTDYLSEDASDNGLKRLASFGVVMLNGTTFADNLNELIERSIIPIEVPKPPKEKVVFMKVPKKTQ